MKSLQIKLSTLAVLAGLLGSSQAFTMLIGSRAANGATKILGSSQAFPVPILKHAKDAGATAQKVFGSACTLAGLTIFPGIPLGLAYLINEHQKKEKEKIDNGALTIENGPIAATLANKHVHEFVNNEATKRGITTLIKVYESEDSNSNGHYVPGTNNTIVLGTDFGESLKLGNEPNNLRKGTLHHELTHLENRDNTRDALLFGTIATEAAHKTIFNQKTAKTVLQHLRKVPSGLGKYPPCMILTFIYMCHCENRADDGILNESALLKAKKDFYTKCKKENESYIDSMISYQKGWKKKLLENIPRDFIYCVCDILENPQHSSDGYRAERFGERLDALENPPTADDVKLKELIAMAVGANSPVDV